MKAPEAQMRFESSTELQEREQKYLTCKNSGNLKRGEVLVAVHPNHQPERVSAQRMG